MSEQGIVPHELDAFSGDGKTRSVDEQPQVAPGHEAEHPFAVQYQGPWETQSDGTCMAVRKHARALSRVGIPVLLQSFGKFLINEQGFPEPAILSRLDDDVREKYGPLTMTEAAVLTPRIKHMVVRDAQALRSAIVPRYLNETVEADPMKLLERRAGVYQSTIAYTVWERDRIQPSIATQLKRCAECWVPCEQNAEMLRSCGVENVCVVPHPYDPEDPICKAVGRRPMQTRRFYTIGRWEPRKEQHLLIGAFLRAFKSSDDVKLTIKHNGNQWEGYPAPRESVGQWLEEAAVRSNGWSWETLPGKLELIEGRIPQDQILKLHFMNNIYVAASHGEAFCLPAFDAKCAGNALVHVAYGGTDAFHDEHRDVKVPYYMGPVDKSYKWEDDAQWASFDLEALTQALREAKAPEAYTLTTQFRQRFHESSVGALMAERIMSVASPEVAEYFRTQMSRKRGA